MRRNEDQIHKAVIQHLRARSVPGVVFWHTPQGARYSSPAQGRIMKALGTLAGVSDLLLFHEGKLFCLELKAPGGRASESQMAFLSAIEAQGAFCCVAEGLDRAIAILETWGLLRGNANLSRAA